jgi:hypothetical protein
MLNDLLANDQVRKRGLFNETYVHRLVREHETCFADHSLLLWGLMSVELWMQRFIDSEPSTSFAVDQRATEGISVT